MKEILVINPGKPKAKRGRKKASKKEVTAMPKRKRARKHARKNGPIRSYKVYAPVKKHRRRAHNPTRVRRAARALGKTLMGMNIKSALGNVPPAVLGMMAAKWASKRFSEGGASEIDPESWTWGSYLKGAAGAFLGGFLAQNVRAGWGQKVLEGGLNLMVYKLVQNELIPKSEWAQGQFGEGDQAAIQYDQTGTPYLLGQDGNWYPVDERHRLPEANVMGDALQVPGRLGDALQVPGRLGDVWQDAYFGQNESAGDRNVDPYAKAFFG